MSLQLEQDAVYLLPDALDGTHYLILRAAQEQGRWLLIEEHNVPHENNALQQRAALKPEERVVFEVQPSGELVPLRRTDSMPDRRWTMTNLSLFGYLRDGVYRQPPEGL